MEKEQNKNVIPSNKDKKSLGMRALAAVSGIALAGGLFAGHEISKSAERDSAPAPVSDKQTIQTYEAPDTYELPPVSIDAPTVETEAPAPVIESEPEASAAPEVSATPEAVAETEYIVTPVGEGDSIEGVAYSYYPELNETVVVDEIEDANPDKDPEEFYAWGTANIPAEINGVEAQDLTVE